MLTWFTINQLKPRFKRIAEPIKENHKEKLFGKSAMGPSIITLHICAMLVLICGYWVDVLHIF